MWGVGGVQMTQYNPTKHFPHTCEVMSCSTKTKWLTQPRGGLVILPPSTTRFTPTRFIWLTHVFPLAQFGLFMYLFVKPTRKFLGYTWQHNSNNIYREFPRAYCLQSWKGPQTLTRNEGSKGGRGEIAYEGHIRAVTGGAMGVWQCVQATFAGLCVGRCINDGSSVPSQMLISAPFTRPTYADIFPVTMGERGRCSQHRIFFFLLSKVASELWQMWGDTVCKRNFRPQCQCSVQTAAWKHAYFRFVWKGTQWKQFAGFCDQMQRWIKVRLFFRCIHFCWNLRERGYILSRVTSLHECTHTHAVVAVANIQFEVFNSKV